MPSDLTTPTPSEPLELRGQRFAFVSQILDADIKRSGESESFMIRAGLLREILDTVSQQASTIEALEKGWRGLDCECDSYHGHTCKRCALLSTLREEKEGL